MAMPSDNPGLSFVARLIGVVKRFTKAAAETSELRRLNDQQVGEIAHDLGLSRTDLFTLCANPDSARLLKLRLDQRGIDEAQLERQYPEVLHDLQRVCGTCTSGSRCSREFAAGDVSRRDEYCPNSWTLQALSKDSPKAEMH